jgi:protein-S-isoprenylcysteine O-methyltransferase Ste14
LSRLDLDAIYLAGLAIAEGLRLPRRLAHARSREGRPPSDGSVRPRELLVMGGLIVGVWLLPLVYVFTPWLNAFDYALPTWTVWPALAAFVLALVVRWAGQSALGESWSPTGGPSSSHLVTTGIYSRIRHPLYASMLLWAIAQAALLQNAFAGFGGAVAAALVWALRVPAEETMLLDRFGAEYAAYARRTGRLIPRIRD